MKIRRVGAELFHAGGQRDRHIDRRTDGRTDRQTDRHDEAQQSLFEIL